MLRTITMVALAVGALTAHVPAHAAASGSCSSILLDTGGGTLIGYAVDPNGGSVTIACYVTVNGVPAPGVPAQGSGTGAAVAVGSYGFEVSASDDVRVCTVVNGSLTGCQRVTRLWFT